MSLVRVKLAKGGHHFRLVMIPRSSSDRLNYLINTNKKQAQDLVVKLAQQSAPAKEKGAEYSVELLKVYLHQDVEINGVKTTLGSATNLWNADQLILSDDSLTTIGEQYTGKLNDDPERDEKLIAVYDEIVTKIADYMPLIANYGVAVKLENARDKFVALPATLSDIQKAADSKTAKGPNKLMMINDLLYGLRPGASRSSALTKIGVKGIVGGTTFPSIMKSGDKIFMTSPAGLNNHTYVLY